MHDYPMMVVTLFDSHDNNQDEFKARVKQSIERCRQEVLNPNVDDPHSIKYVV